MTLSDGKVASPRHYRRKRNWVWCACGADQHLRRWSNTEPWRRFFSATLRIVGNRRGTLSMPGGVGGGARKSSSYPIVPGMALIWEVEVLLGRLAGTDSGRQLRRREAGWGGSRKQNSELTNRNRISGRCGGVTRQRTGIPESQTDTRTGKSGGDRVKDQRLTLGSSFGLGTIPSRWAATCTDAEGEVSRGHSSPGTDEGPNSTTKEQVRPIR